MYAKKTNKKKSAIGLNHSVFYRWVKINHRSREKIVFRRWMRVGRRFRDKIVINQGLKKVKQIFIRY